MRPQPVRPPGRLPDQRPRQKPSRPVAEDAFELAHFDLTQGEHVHMDERLILSPIMGRVRLLDRPVRGEFVLRGETIAMVAGASGGDPIPVPASADGWVMGFLVPDGCPVNRSEPLAWMRPEWQ